MLQIVNTINSYLSDYILVFLLVAVGLWYTVKTKCVQRYLWKGLKQLFGGFSLRGGSQGGGMSSFQAVATAIAAQVGTGNIVGSAGAILVGGPGAIFWMWIIAFLGMATIYAEATLAQKTRVTDAEGNIQGGPVYYIQTAFKGKFGTFLAGFFSIAIILALGFFGCMVQSNSIGSTIQMAFGLQYIPETFGLIFKYAFQPQAIIGGGFGIAIKTAVSQGAKRGLFSNEAGMGSTPHAHALALVKNPHEQGCVAMVGVFIDTFIVLTLNALVIISTLYAGNGPLANGYVGEAANTLKNTNLAQVAFGVVYGDKAGAVFVAICLFFFAFSTILGWNLFAKINVTYLFGKKAQRPFMLVALVFIFLGTIGESDLVWACSDMFNQLMVIPNAIALFALTGVVTKILGDRDK